MNIDNMKKAAGLACQLRSLLEEMYSDQRDAGTDYELESVLCDLASDAENIESALDEYVEGM